MESNPPPAPKPPVDKKTPPLGNNIVWYLLGIGMAILMVVGWLNQPLPYELSYSDLVDLIKSSAPNSKPYGITIQEGSEGREQKVHYEKPNDIKIGTFDVIGKVIRQVDAASSGAAAGGYASGRSNGQHC